MDKTPSTSEPQVEFDDALSRVFGAVAAACKSKKNPAFGSMYSTLQDVDGACRSSLVGEGFSFPQYPSAELLNGAWVVTVRTEFRRKGLLIESSLGIPVPKANAQTFGSAITYGRRYCLAAMCGVVADDDDGNAASAKRSNNDQRDDYRPRAPIAELNPTDEARKELATAFRLYEAACGEGNMEPRPWKHVFEEAIGREWSDDKSKQTVEDYQMAAQHCKALAHEVANA